MPKGSPHALSSSPFLFSWAFNSPIPYDMSPKEFHTQDVEHPIICWLLVFYSSTKQEETLKKKEKKKIKKKIKH